MGNGSRKVIVSSNFFQEKAKAQGVFKQGAHAHKVAHKRVIRQIGSNFSKLPKIISRDSSISQSDQQGKF